MRATWQFLAVLAAVVFVVYAPSAGNGFLYEDRALLNGLPEQPGQADYLREAAQVTTQGAWAPLARMTLMVQRAGAEPEPAPFRAVNIALLALIGWAAFGFMRQAPLLVRRIPAFLGALLLVTHPVASTSIYHIGEGRSTLLALLLVLGSAAFYLRGGGWRLALATILFVLALGCSAHAIWFPVVLLAAEAVGLPGRNGAEAEHRRREPSLLKVIPKKEQGGKRWLRPIPLLAAAGLYGMLAEKVTAGVPDLTPIGERMPGMEILYIWQVLAAPQRAAVCQPALDAWMVGGRFLAGVGLVALLVIGVVMTFRHPDATPVNRRRDEARRLTFWVAWLIVGLLGATGYVSGEPLFNERLILPFSVAVWGLLAWCITRFWEFELFRMESTVAGIGVAIVLAAISLGRRDCYKDDETFTSQWAKTNPGAWQIFDRRAGLWEKAGNLSFAEQQLQRGLTLQPESVGMREHLASLQEKGGRLEEAVRTLQGLSGDHPTNFNYRIQAADLNLKLGRYRESVVAFEKLIETMPENEEVKRKLESAKKAEREGMKQE